MGEADNKGVLFQDGEEGSDWEDYTLAEDAYSCWITVGTISVYVRHTEEGVSVDLYERYRENYDSLASCEADFPVGIPPTFTRVR